MILRYETTEQDRGRALLRVLRGPLGLSAALVRRLKTTGAIRVDGQPVFTDYRLAPGQVVTVALEEPMGDVIPEQGPLDILYEDGHILAVCKPHGVLVHPSPSRNSGTLLNFAAGYLSAPCHAVNRLDRDTSGVVLLAKSGHAKARLIESLRAPEAEKWYLALCAGRFDAPTGTVDAPIYRPDPRDLRRTADPRGSAARTDYRVLAEADGASVLLLRLHTGRTHQIRVHMASTGHPLLGDRLYGDERSLALSARLGIDTQALHAARLRFVHPFTGEALTLTTPCRREGLKKYFCENFYFSS